MNFFIKFNLLILVLMLSSYAFTAFTVISPKNNIDIDQEYKELLKKIRTDVNLSDASLLLTTSLKNDLSKVKKVFLLKSFLFHVREGSLQSFIEENGKIKSIKIYENDFGILPKVSHVFCLESENGCQSGVIRIQR